MTVQTMPATEKRVLVTGALGFLGQRLVHCLADTDYSVVRAGHTQTQGSGEILCDLESPSDLLSLLTDVKPNVIINLAAKIIFDDKKADSLFSLNSLAPALMADYCKKQDAHLVQASSCSVHGFSHRLFNEDTLLLPDTAYGKSKLLADDYIRASNCRSSIIRFGGIFGPKGPPHLGINKAITNAANGIVPEMKGDGSGKRNYIFVDDAAMAITAVVQKNLLGTFYAGGQTLALSEMLDQICNTWMPDETVLRTPGGQTHDQICDSSPGLPTTHTFRDCLNLCKTRLA